MCYVAIREKCFYISIFDFDIFLLCRSNIHHCKIASSQAAAGGDVAFFLLKAFVTLESSITCLVYQRSRMDEILLGTILTFVLIRRLFVPIILSVVLPPLSLVTLDIYMGCNIGLSMCKISHGAIGVTWKSSDHL